MAPRALETILCRLGSLGGMLEAILERCCAILNYLGGHPGASEALLEPSWAILYGLAPPPPSPPIPPGWGQEGAKPLPEGEGGVWEEGSKISQRDGGLWAIAKARPPPCGRGSGGGPLFERRAGCWKSEPATPPASRGSVRSRRASCLAGSGGTPKDQGTVLFSLSGGARC